MPPVLLGPVERVAVVGAGTAFPSHELSNEDVLRAVAPFAWPERARPPEGEQLAFIAASMRETLGVEMRAWAHRVGAPIDHAEATTLDLGIAAAERALEDARMSATELSLVLFATSTPHRMTSTLAAPLGAALGTRAACMDTRAGCAGGLFALTTAALYLGAGSGPVLVVGAETFSKIIPPASKVAAMALGDGAGALVLARRDPTALVASSLETDGELGRLITTDGALPPTPDEIARGGYALSGAPDELGRVVPSKYAAAIEAVLTRAELTPRAIDLFVPHQTQATLIESVAANAGIAREKTYVNVERHANVGAAGWIVALAEARAEGRVARGANVLLAAVGGGMSWGAVVLKC